MRTIKMLSDVGNCFFARTACAVPGMEIVELDPEFVATSQVIEEGVVGLFRAVGVWVREIYEVGAVRDACGGWGDVVGGAGGGEDGDVLGGEVGEGPFALGF